MINGKFYDIDYFDRGIETGKSLYTNYRWLPELTIALSMSYIDYLGITRKDKVLDYGCGKGGFMVKALRILYRQAWGCDISEYAINSADNDTRQYLKVSSLKPSHNIVPFFIGKKKCFDYILAKDVFEHIDEEELDIVLQALREKGKYLFACQPLGDNGKFVVPAYNMDITHRTIQNKDWWTAKFKKNGWKVVKFSYYVPGIKDSWSNFEHGNGFFLLKSR